VATNDKVKVAVVGASGYSGIEAVRILSSHPFVELSVLTSEHYAGREVADVYRHMAGIDLPPFEELRPDLVQGRAEVAISCLPETVGTAHTAELIKAGVKVVDLSADYRFKDPAQFRTTYGIEHPAPQLLKEAVYGLSEFHRHELREARLVATPGEWRLVCRFLGRLHHKTIHALPRQASEKRQGTKSRAGRGSVSPLRSMGI